MRVSKKILTILVFVPLVAGLGACSSALIGERKGADKVSLADAKQVTACEPKGKTIVSVLAKVGIFARDEEDVEENLLQLARNNAVDAGADTLVKGESLAYNKRLFEMFKCRP